ncbi:MAG TPA: AlwI family type II restriction endonuclease [Candidatus Enterocloster faecavium]|uniref:AlwI family type II restriction endonuclease n=1 Tax=Candidatus Enterocloster faecavium TaxID=2838560 RepID=A0A9D2L9U9_9FIRM|nr:AlwI family type II restriction endonuclease [Candidatus Enterocloster faecavium]
MKITNPGQIFNLMDTNGRRNDVVNALQGYLTILDQVQNEKKMTWAALPQSLAQYIFYQQAIRMFPEVFRQHGPYDQLQKILKDYPDFEEALRREDGDWILRNQERYAGLIRKFDSGIEDRARHYTSTLVKLGFAGEEREISPAGWLLLNPGQLKRDQLEHMLPIDHVNLIYLRQLLKLRIFAGDRYYAPFQLALFALLKRERVTENEFLELVQGLSPYSDFQDLEKYVLDYQEGQIAERFKIEIPAELKGTAPVTRETFYKYFKNGKSGGGIEIYWEYYCRLRQYAKGPDEESLDHLLTFYEANKAMLNKAFGRGRNVFALRTGERPLAEKFSQQYKGMLGDDLNEVLYRQFLLSKKLDQIREYSDTTKRIFKATGLIRFDHGFVELAYRELCACIFQENRVRERILGNLWEEVWRGETGADGYEDGADSYFCSVTSLCEIFGYGQEEQEQIKAVIQMKFSGADMGDISRMMARQRRKEFAAFVESVYPKERVRELLGLFEDRTKDKQIKELVSPDATVPTIYEYLVGIAWYYFSGKKIDLLGSYNLTLSANFEPLVHAGGGQGDIVIYEDTRVVMLEATLMNQNSQKRGEWEPVLRHSINLKAEEEAAGTGREVTTFFIADRFDYNTINIWKAVASVPLQSSADPNRFTDHVVIMPVNTRELCALMEQSSHYGEMISRVHQLFEVEGKAFDMDWRDKFMDAIV